MKSTFNHASCYALNRWAELPEDAEAHGLDNFLKELKRDERKKFVEDAIKKLLRPFGSSVLLFISLYILALKTAAFTHTFVSAAAAVAFYCAMFVGLELQLVVLRFSQSDPGKIIGKRMTLLIRYLDVIPLLLAVIAAVVVGVHLFNYMEIIRHG